MIKNYKIKINNNKGLKIIQKKKKKKKKKRLKNKKKNSINHII